VKLDSKRRQRAHSMRVLVIKMRLTGRDGPDR